MKLGDIITKEEFLRLAPLGLEASYDGTTYSYCRTNAEAFKIHTLPNMPLLKRRSL